MTIYRRSRYLHHIKCTPKSKKCKAISKEQVEKYDQKVNYDNCAKEAKAQKKWKNDALATNLVNVWTHKVTDKKPLGEHVKRVVEMGWGTEM